MKNTFDNLHDSIEELVEAISSLPTVDTQEDAKRHAADLICGFATWLKGLAAEPTDDVIDID